MMIADLDAFELEVISDFVEMERASREVGRRFLMGGGGFDKHDAARSVAPEWLRKWDDDYNWAICFANGYCDLLGMTKSFGYSRERFLNELLTYRDRFSTKVLEAAQNDIGPYSPDDKKFIAWASVQATRDTVKAKGRPRQYSDEQVQIVRDMKRDGFTWAEIVEATGVNRSSARKMCEGE